MNHGFCLIFVCLLLIPMTVMAEEAGSCPCALDPSSICIWQEHKIDKEIDLRELYFMENEIDNPETGASMLDSGYIRILDDQQLMEIDLQFSKNFDYEAHDQHLPEIIAIRNYVPCDSLGNSNRESPKWKYPIFPDRDDPYSFHYIGTFNWTMVQFSLHNIYTDQQGKSRDCFSVDIEVY